MPPVITVISRPVRRLFAQAEDFLPPLILDEVQVFDDPMETWDVRGDISELAVSPQAKQ